MFKSQSRNKSKKTAENFKIVLKTIQPCHSYHSCLLLYFLFIWMFIKGNLAKICLFSLQNWCQTPSPSLLRSAGAWKAKFNTAKALIYLLLCHHMKAAHGKIILLLMDSCFPTSLSRPQWCSLCPLELIYPHSNLILCKRSPNRQKMNGLFCVNLRRKPDSQIAESRNTQPSLSNFYGWK